MKSVLKDDNLSFLENLVILFSRKIRENRVSLSASFIVGLLTYIYCFTNKLETMDDLGLFFSAGGSLSLGRWGLKLSEYVFPTCSVPWLNGILSLVFLSIAISLIIRMFHITDPILVILLSAVLVSFPTQVCTFGYMYTAPQYACSLLLAVSAAKAASEAERGKDILRAVILLAFSMGIYQAYLPVAVSLLIVSCISRALNGEAGKTVFRKGLLYIAVAGVSAVLYYVINLIVNAVLHVEMGEYASNSLNGIGDVLFGIRVAYTAFIGYFTKGYYDLIPTKASLVFHLAAVLVTILLLIAHFRKKENRDGGKLAVTLLCLFLLPLGINCIRVISSLFHNLMLYGFTAVYVLAAVVFQACSEDIARTRKKIAKDLLIVSLAAVTAVNVYYANCVFVKMFMQFEQAESFYTNIVSQFSSDPEFNQESVICIVGSNHILDMIPIDTKDVAGVREGIIGTYSQDEFIRLYLGMNLNIAGWDITDELESREEVMEMPSYPYYGSLRKIDDYYVVKLG